MECGGIAVLRRKREWLAVLEELACMKWFAYRIGENVIGGWLR